jgi:hypothetical protein
MQFRVPQFLERQPLIIGPLAFKQSLYFGVAILMLVLIHSIAPFPIFLICAVVLIGMAFGLAFIKIEGIPLPEVIIQSFGFVLSPKMYLWQKKENLRPVKFIAKKQEEKEEEPLRVAPKSILKKLHSKIEGGY